MQLIITKYLEGQASNVEQAKLLVWLRKKENRLIFNRFSLEWKESLDVTQLPSENLESWNNIQTALLQKSYAGWQTSRKMNQFFRVAAIFFFVISIGSSVYFYMNQTEKFPEVYTNVMAENGQISKVELPDGSLVWLNSGSEISYSNFYASKNREIKLTGEAYFQVTRNEDIPLIVNSGELKIKVLGTKFNVSVYPESDHIDVVLVSGKVELLNSNIESFSYFLKPGERAVFDRNNRNLKVSNVNTTKFTSWKDGIVNIYNQPLEEVAKRLETRYNQKFEFTDEVKGFHYTFTIKNESLDEIIKLMEKITPVKATQKEHIISFKLDQSKKRRPMEKI